MDSLQRPNHLDRLPTELKCSVVRHIRSLADQQALSLVNKAWAEVVAPVLWETFTTDLVQSGQRHVLGLAHPKSNIVKHVRNINLLSRVHTTDDHLPALLEAIPRGQLRRFRCVSGVAIPILKFLLRLHPKLEEFTVSTAGAFSRVLEAPWTAGCFSNIDSVDIQLLGFSHEAFQKLWVQCPKLEHLRLTPTFGTPSGAPVALPALYDHHFLLSQDDSSQKRTGCTDTPIQPLDALKLSSLYAKHIALPNSFDAMFQRIDVLALRELTIDGASGVVALADALASKFAEGEPLLTKLRIVNLSEQSMDGINQSLLLLLLAFHGLCQLHIQCTNSGKIEVDGIVNHGDTLTDLLIVNGGIYREDQSKCMSASDLRRIAKACPRIEQICLNLYEIDPDSLEGEVLGPHPSIPFEATEFEQALSAIACLPNLQIVRFTNSPDYRKAYNRYQNHTRWFPRSLERGEQRCFFQARADGIMRYLGDRKSNLKLLVFSPIEKLQGAEYADKNGHFWPKYFYYRGRVTDHKGTDIAVARPLADWKVDFPWATVLEEF